MGKVIKQKAIPFPEALNQAGMDIRKTAGEVVKDSLKPAILKDLTGVLFLLSTIQQLIVTLYNGAVHNDNEQRAMIAKLEKRVKELEEKGKLKH